MMPNAHSSDVNVLSWNKKSVRQQHFSLSLSLSLSVCVCVCIYMCVCVFDLVPSLIELPVLSVLTSVCLSINLSISPSPFLFSSTLLVCLLHLYLSSPSMLSLAATMALSRCGISDSSTRTARKGNSCTWRCGCRSLFFISLFLYFFISLFLYFPYFFISLFLLFLYFFISFISLFLYFFLFFLSFLSFFLSFFFFFFLSFFLSFFLFIRFFSCITIRSLKYLVPNIYICVSPPCSLTCHQTLFLFLYPRALTRRILHVISLFCCNIVSQGGYHFDSLASR